MNNWVTAKAVQLLEAKAGMLVNAAWYPGQRRIVSCDEEAEVRVWEQSDSR